MYVNVTKLFGFHFQPGFMDDDVLIDLDQCIPDDDESWSVFFEFSAGWHCNYCSYSFVASLRWLLSVPKRRCQKITLCWVRWCRSGGVAVVFDFFKYSSPAHLNLNFCVVQAGWNGENGRGPAVMAAEGHFEAWQQAAQVLGRQVGEGFATSQWWVCRRFALVWCDKVVVASETCWGERDDPPPPPAPFHMRARCCYILLVRPLTFISLVYV